MTDIVDRLRVYILLPDNTALIDVAVLGEAADEIERLRAVLRAWEDAALGEGK